MKEETTEKELLEEVKKGDRQAMHSLYSRYVGYAMAVALRYVPDRDEVRDVVQDSFVKVLSSVSRFEYRGEGSLKAWVTRIVANEALSYVKGKQKITFVSEIPDGPEEDVETTLVPPKELTRMIGELPNGYRLVLNLYVFEQRSHKEIAQQLGITENTSASQYLRAKKLLAKKIKEYLKQHDYEQ